MLSEQNGAYYGRLDASFRSPAGRTARRQAANARWIPGEPSGAREGSTPSPDARARGVTEACLSCKEAVGFESSRVHFGGRPSSARTPSPENRRRCLAGLWQGPPFPRSSTQWQHGLAPRSDSYKVGAPVRIGVLPRRHGVAETSEDLALRRRFDSDWRHAAAVRRTHASPSTRGTRFNSGRQQRGIGVTGARHPSKLAVPVQPGDAAWGYCRREILRTGRLRVRVLPGLPGPVG